MIRTLQEVTIALNAQATEVTFARTAISVPTEKGEPMAELKHCPFCGGEAFVSYDHDGVCDTSGRHWAYTVVCNKCCATSGLTYSRERAIEAWNKRTERPKGQWVYKEGGFVCSNCEGDIPQKVNFCRGCYMDADDVFSNFCPNCGADMRGESDG